MILCVACAPHSMEEYKLEGEGIAKSLLKQLEKVHSVNDLVETGPRLKKEYAKLLQLMVAAKKYQNAHPEEEVGDPIGLEVSDALKREFIRIYQLEGCSDVMEALQRESLHKLDLSYRRLEGLKTETFR